MAKKGVSRGPKSKRKYSRHLQLGLGYLSPAPRGRGRHQMKKPRASEG